MIHKGGHKGSHSSTKTTPRPRTQPNHLIKRGSQTTCNRKLTYHDSCTLCKGSTMYPRVVISSLAKRLAKPPFCHSYTFFSVWPRDHYIPLQMSTTEACHAFLRFPTKALRAVLSIPDKGLSCTMWVRHFTKYITKYDLPCQSPLNRTRHTIYSIPN
jgi:hypothetical protein